MEGDERVEKLRAARAAVSRSSRPDEILPGLFCGSLSAARDARLLAELGITHVLAVHDSPKALHSGLSYCLLTCSDSAEQELGEVLRQGLGWVEAARAAGGRVLVHCVMGASRSVSLVLAYVAAVTGLGVAEALEVVRERRPAACPNPAFLRQLREVEDLRALLAPSAKLLPREMRDFEIDRCSALRALDEARRRRNRANAHKSLHASASS
jgi:hypothetical protein